jgi:hypothetical protein
VRQPDLATPRPNPQPHCKNTLGRHDVPALKNAQPRSVNFPEELRREQLYGRECPARKHHTARRSQRVCKLAAGIQEDVLDARSSAGASQEDAPCGIGAAKLRKELRESLKGGSGGGAAGSLVRVLLQMDPFHTYASRATAITMQQAHNSLGTTKMLAHPTRKKAK